MLDPGHEGYCDNEILSCHLEPLTSDGTEVADTTQDIERVVRAQPLTDDDGAGLPHLGYRPRFIIGPLTNSGREPRPPGGTLISLDGPRVEEAAAVWRGLTGLPPLAPQG